MIYNMHAWLSTSTTKENVTKEKGVEEQTLFQKRSQIAYNKIKKRLLMNFSNNNKILLTETLLHIKGNLFGCPPGVGNSY